MDRFVQSFETGAFVAALGVASAFRDGQRRALKRRAQRVAFYQGVAAAADEISRRLDRIEARRENEDAEPGDRRLDEVEIQRAAFARLRALGIG